MAMEIHGIYLGRNMDDNDMMGAEGVPMDGCQRKLENQRGRKEER